MNRRIFLALAMAAAATPPCRAQDPANDQRRSANDVMPTLVETGKHTTTGYDEFYFGGWSHGCSAALRYISYPPTGEGMEGVPTTWAIGTLTIRPADPRVHEDWLYKAVDSKFWERWRAEDAAGKLSQRYVFPGRVERLPATRSGKEPGPDETLIRSTAAFQLADPVRWPSAPFQLSEIRYSPLGTCLFTVFRSTASPMDTYRYRLIRIKNPSVRRVRARAHVSQGLLLYQESDIYGALEEVAAAAEMDPEFALARYHHAAMLAAHGRNDEALAELKAAIALDPRTARQAEKAVEFQNISWDQRFQQLVNPKKAKR